MRSYAWLFALASYQAPLCDFTDLLRYPWLFATRQLELTSAWDLPLDLTCDWLTFFACALLALAPIQLCARKRTARPY